MVGVVRCSVHFSVAGIDDPGSSFAVLSDSDSIFCCHCDPLVVFDQSLAVATGTYRGEAWAAVLFGDMVYMRYLPGSSAGKGFININICVHLCVSVVKHLFTCACPGGPPGHW